MEITSHQSESADASKKNEINDWQTLQEITENWNLDDDAEERKKLYRIENIKEIDLSKFEAISSN